MMKTAVGNCENEITLGRICDNEASFVVELVDPGSDIEPPTTTPLRVCVECVAEFRGFKTVDLQEKR